MSKVTNKISSLLRITPSDVPVRILKDDELFEDIKRGSPNRTVTKLATYPERPFQRGLYIIDDDEFHLVF